MYMNLPPERSGKIIPLNFGSIKHLGGSRMIDDEDKLIDTEIEYALTVKKNNTSDKIYVTEKVDGMNAGVIKSDGLLYPINRKGYDSRLMGKVYKELSTLGLEWAYWVDEHYALYDSMLEDGERLVFENCIMTSTLKYKFKRDPVLLLAKYDKSGNRLLYEELRHLGKTKGIDMPELLCSGIPIKPKEVIKHYPNGVVGVTDDIEGVVYVSEVGGKYKCSAKYVSNIKVGSYKPMPTEYNKFKRRTIPQM